MRFRRADAHAPVVQPPRPAGPAQAPAAPSVDGAAQQQGTNDTEQARQATLALHPIGRLGVAEDIAKGIVFLASDDAGYMNGAGLIVDGGMTAT